MVSYYSILGEGYAIKELSFFVRGEELLPGVLPSWSFIPYMSITLGKNLEC